MERQGYSETLDAFGSLYAQMVEAGDDNVRIKLLMPYCQNNDWLNAANNLHGDLMRDRIELIGRLKDVEQVMLNTSGVEKLKTALELGIDNLLNYIHRDATFLETFSARIAQDGQAVEYQGIILDLNANLQLKRTEYETQIADKQKSLGAIKELEILEENLQKVDGVLRWLENVTARIKQIAAPPVADGTGTLPPGEIALGRPAIPFPQPSAGRRRDALLPGAPIQPVVIDDVAATATLPPGIHKATWPFAPTAAVEEGIEVRTTPLIPLTPTAETATVTGPIPPIIFSDLPFKPPEKVWPYEVLELGGLIEFYERLINARQVTDEVTAIEGIKNAFMVRAKSILKHLNDQLGFQIDANSVQGLNNPRDFISFIIGELKRINGSQQSTGAVNLYHQELWDLNQSFSIYMTYDPRLWDRQAEQLKAKIKKLYDEKIEGKIEISAELKTSLSQFL